MAIYFEMEGYLCNAIYAFNSAQLSRELQIDLWKIHHNVVEIAEIVKFIEYIKYIYKSISKNFQF
jgi:hypothetical protein